MDNKYKMNFIIRKNIIDDKYKMYLFKAMCRNLHRVHGYSINECKAYMQGYLDCQKFMQKNYELHDEPEGKVYYQINIPDEDKCKPQTNNVP